MDVSFSWRSVLARSSDSSLAVSAASRAETTDDSAERSRVFALRTDSLSPSWNTIEYGGVLSSIFPSASRVRSCLSEATCASWSSFDEVADCCCAMTTSICLSRSTRLESALGWSLSFPADSASCFSCSIATRSSAATSSCLFSSTAEDVSAAKSSSAETRATGFDASRREAAFGEMTASGCPTSRKLGTFDAGASCCVADRFCSVGAAFASDGRVPAKEVTHRHSSNRR